MTYELRVQGHLDAHWSRWLGDVEVIRCGDGSTLLRAAITDQAHLYGVIAALRDMGATLLSVQTFSA